MIANIFPADISARPELYNASRLDEGVTEAEDLLAEPEIRHHHRMQLYSCLSSPCDCSRSIELI